MTRPQNENLNQKKARIRAAYARYLKADNAALSALQDAADIDVLRDALASVYGNDWTHVVRHRLPE